MATAISSSKPARQLGELLQEQQDPFILEVYLSERGCTLRKKFNLGADNSGKFLKKSGGNGSQNKSKKGTVHSFPKVLKVVCNKLFTIKGSRNYKSSEDGKLGNVCEMEDRNQQESAEPDVFSSASSTTVYNSCSDSDIDESSTFPDNPNSVQIYNQRENKAAADHTKLQWSCMEDSKQHSPVSVLEEISTSRDNKTRPVNYCGKQKSLFLPKLIAEDSILSASLLNLLLQATPAKSTCSEPDHLSTSSPIAISRRALQQTKQILFDCVRELVDSHGKKEERAKGSESEKIRVLGKQSGDESNIKQLLKKDVMDSMQQWGDLQSQKWDIGLLIGNIIFEEITTEVLMDMIN
ncbi:hypothetical protein CCACVL1_30130 [Corchorus capsularis]|uniref:DUF4378 domain-containing protein n=1 Tax=Corchorus capsularis TaxID=210143 RepID=A0A1R3FYP1_COCAP|nr:hypothetical protein CCACVL1_30130 [Corchorus capsularis]